MLKIVKNKKVKQNKSTREKKMRKKLANDKTHLVAARESDGPALKAADELLAGDIALGVANNTPGDDEREDSRATAVGQLGESVQKRHHRIPMTALM